MSEFIAFLSSIHPVLVCILVCISKGSEIFIQSLRVCLMVKGQRLRAAMLGAFECIVWGLCISTIIPTLGDNLFLLAFYAFGYAVGLYLGSAFESKLAIGTSSVELIANDENTNIIKDYLHKHNKGFTVVEGHGYQEKMNMIYIVLPRKEVSKTINDIQNMCNHHVFIAASEVSRHVGGYGAIKNK